LILALNEACVDNTNTDNIQTTELFV